MPRDSATRLNIDELLKAYSLGYFPMARSRVCEEVIWVLPDQRGVLRLDRIHCPRKLRRLVARAPFEIRIDSAFSDVIRECAAPGPDRPDTWINDAIEETYTELFRLGLAHCVECWRGGELAGGVYGVALGGIFFGESMFSRRTNASKIALLHLVAGLKSSGFGLLDAQFHTEHLAQFGVEEIPDREYQILLKDALARPAAFQTNPDCYSSAAVLQSITQTS